jgi:hypothetical protein
MNEQTAPPQKRRWVSILLFITGILVILLVAGYFIGNAVIRHKMDQALRSLPPTWQVAYNSLQVNILTGSLVIHGLKARFMPEKAQQEKARPEKDQPEKDQPEKAHVHEFSVDRLAVGGIHLLELLIHHRLRIRSIDVDGISASLDEYLLEKDTSLPAIHLPFTEVLIDRLTLTGLTIKGGEKEKKGWSVKGSLELDSVTEGTNVEGKVEPTAGAVRMLVEKATYPIPGMEETARLQHLELDSRKRLLRLDSLQITPNMDREEIGRIRGHQVDVVKATSEGIDVKNLDVMALLQHQLIADEISIGRSELHVFRDRRLPLEPGEKALPMEGLKSMPLSLRVGRLKMGMTTFAYEEFPQKGNQTGMLTIYRMRTTLAPLINKPVHGDPAYITMTSQGSLMNSGSVTAMTKMPLHKGDPYIVEGAFHELDVTKLNNPAENLGGLHLESGMLNSLAFWFEMNDEIATGHIVGEYHDLVVDKLKGNSDDKKVDKMKSFALKKFIIPKDKDKSLPVSKRTGKVDYKRDKERYFSYYLLHSLLVGVKSSFSLGFLLPG